MANSIVTERPRACHDRSSTWPLDTLNELEKGIIADYAILAPSEGSFHPQGISVRGLETSQAEVEIEVKQQAALWINAIDPCAGYKLRVIM